LIDIIMGYQCNVQCDYCTITPEMRSKNLTTAQIAKALEQGRAAGLTEAAFGGGEPTMRKDLVKLTRLASTMGYRTIKISSNGLMYAYPDFVEKLLDAGANQFNLALMGWNEGMYERIMGRARYFDLVRQGVGHLVSRDARVVGDIIMKHDTARELADTVEYWAELGVERFVFWLMSLTDRVRDHKEQLVPVSELRPHLFEAFEVGRRRGIPVHSRHIPLCMLPGYHDHVWDVRADRILIVTPESTFWLSESRITANTFVAKCDGCSLRPRCMGIRQDYLENVGDGEVEPQP
jgi:MoaA/NifB/PqqE/SkfB family radical SAM enzyme